MIEVSSVSSALSRRSKRNSTISREFRSILLWLSIVGLGGAGVLQAEVVDRKPEPIVGLPCEGCDAVFDGLPAELQSATRIAGVDEPGTPLRIDGKVTDASGRPVAGVIVYAYQTDAQGIYPKDEEARGQARYRHGVLRAWVQSDAQGRYRFETIRPAGYPQTSIPEHVHMHIIEVGRCSYYIDDLLFSDDPRLTPSRASGMSEGRGGNGVATPVRSGDGWTVGRDIVLGQAVQGYEGCRS